MFYLVVEGDGKDDDHTVLHHITETNIASALEAFCRKRGYTNISHIGQGYCQNTLDHTKLCMSTRFCTAHNCHGKLLYLSIYPFSSRGIHLNLLSQ